MTDNPGGQERISSRFTRSLVSERRDLNNGFGNALAKAFELALTPAIMAFLGWRLDLLLGTSPLFLIFFFLFTACYCGWRMYVGYDAEMRRQEQRMSSHRRVDP